MRLSKLFAACTTAGLLAFGPTFAGDHEDSPTATADPLADILDVYGFVNPNDAQEAILVLTVSSFTDPGDQFSDAIDYKFNFQNEPGLTAEVTCNFSPDQVVSCFGPTGKTVSGPINQTNTNGDFRVYAGIRDDPFFFDQPKFVETVMTGSPQFTDPGTDFYLGSNILALVVGVNIEDVSPEPDGAKAHFNHKYWGSTERRKGGGVSGNISGTWVPTGDDGQGYLLEVSDNVTDGTGDDDLNGSDDDFVAFFFGYDMTDQLYLVGSTELDGNQGDTVSVGVIRTAGAQFPPNFASDDVVKETVGVMSFQFADFSNGTVTFDSDDPNLPSFTHDIQRLTRVSGTDGTLRKGGQIDRMGRVAVNTALIPAELKDAYNFDSDPSTWVADWSPTMSGSLEFVDGLDGMPGNLLTGDADTLANILADDRLLFYMNIPDCGSYLAIEAAGLGGVEPTECGGRTLDADVIDVTLSALVSGFEVTVTDNVDSNDKAFLSGFPFLAEPHDTFADKPQ